MRNYAVLLVVALVALLAAACDGGEATPTPTPTPNPSPTPAYKTYTNPPEMTIDTSKQYTATITTDHGDMVLELFAADVPNTVNNFVFLAQDGFYDNSSFHRVLPGFMAQGGDPTGTGTGTPGYYIPNEITSHTHVTGALSMANSGADRNGCQFFICYEAKPHLDGSYSVFGQLIEGWEVFESLTPRNPEEYPTFPGDTIVTITIEVSD